MLHTIKKTSTFILFLLCSLLTTWAQEADSLNQAPDISEEAILENATLNDYWPLPSNVEYAPPVPLRSIDAHKWTDATKNLDYSKDVVNEVKPQKKGADPLMPPLNNNTNTTGPWFKWDGLGKILQVLIIALTLFGIGYAIHRMMQQPQNKRIAYDGTVITSDNVDQYLHETDLDRFLKDALKQQNYALAIRLYYLQIIKDLSGKNAIQWSREKTNRDYQREMRSHHLADPFRRATRSFEQVWYGNEGLSAAEYASLEPQFKGLLQQINA